MKFPKTKRDDTKDVIFGHTIFDPYRWLEDPESADTKEWIDLQNARVDGSLRTENFGIFSDELAQNLKTVDFSSPRIVKGKYFYQKRDINEDHYVFYVKEGINGSPIRLIDPNGMNKGNTISLDFCYQSRTGKYVAYGLSEDGTEMSTMYIKNVETTENLVDQIPQCRYSSVCWIPDDSGFFYTRNPRVGTVPKDEEHLHTKVYFHKLSENPENDELIFGAHRPKDDMVSLGLSLDGRYLSIRAGQKFAEHDVYIYDNTTKETKPLVIGIPAHFITSFLKDRVLLLTNYKANNYRVLSVPLKNLFTHIDEWSELIPQTENLLESISATKDKILAEYLVNACSKVIIFDYDGMGKGEIPLPAFSRISGIAAYREEREFFYSVSSFVIPRAIYRYLPEEDRFAEYLKASNPVNPDNYVVKQEWYKSKDGTDVPMFIFHKKNIARDVPHPTILHGYGGFGNSLTPSFMKTYIPWTEHGGIFVIANIRGGGEFGKAWHEQGIKENKQNSYDDFIAAAEYLIRQKYTDSKHLGILGGSNGGLLVSVVSIQRPELFKAVCSRVPLTDMVRFPLFGIALRWVHEYGDPKIKKDLEMILTWSPYHNIKEGVEYPATFFTTANKDSRVDPLHARKMAALLQSINKENDILVFTEMEAGHGSGKPIKKIVESQALILTFFAQELGLPF